ncbi:hypothetical protein ACO0RG_000178 [Hanseniaspora osmophila]
MSSSIMNQIIEELRLPTHNPVQNTPKHGRRAAIVRAAKKAKTTISTIKNDGKVRADKMKDAAKIKAVKMKADGKVCADKMKDAAKIKAAKMKAAAKVRADKMKDAAKIKAAKMKDAAKVCADKMKDAAKIKAAKMKDAAKVRADKMKDAAKIKAAKMKGCCKTKMEAAELRVNAKVCAAKIKKLIAHFNFVAYTHCNEDCNEDENEDENDDDNKNDNKNDEEYLDDDEEHEIYKAIEARRYSNKKTLAHTSNITSLGGFNTSSIPNFAPCSIGHTAEQEDGEERSSTFRENDYSGNKKTLAHTSNITSLGGFNTTSIPNFAPCSIGHTAEQEGEVLEESVKKPNFQPFHNPIPAIEKYFRGWGASLNSTPPLKEL